MSAPLAMTILVLLASLVLGFSITPARAVEPDEMLKDPALEARARALTQELRCVVCQNQSVDDSDAPLARDIRILVRERIAAGDSDEKASDFIVKRYGDFVLLTPPLRGDTLLLWLGPALLIGAGLALAWSYMRKLRRASEPNPLTPAEEDRVQRILDDDAREGL